jgi:hypothetical protein
VVVGRLAHDGTEQHVVMAAQELGRAVQNEVRAELEWA